jgi:hypothetical protein
VNRLSIAIKSAEVRLITSVDDLYVWRFLPEKQHLFRKHLSKHSVKTYKELCREIDVSFEAVLIVASDHASKEETEADAIVCDLSHCSSLAHEDERNPRMSKLVSSSSSNS